MDRLTERAAPQLALLIAVLITIPIAQSLYQIPIQVSDSLEPIVVAASAASVRELIEQTPRFSVATLRPLRWIQARWLLNTVSATGLSYHAVFRGVHVALLVALVALFVAAARVRTWTDLAAFGFALPVLIGIHTFAAMLFEAYPVNHYAEVGVCALAVIVLATRPPRWYFPILICALLALALSVVESGAMVWIVVIGCVAVQLRGVTRSTAIATSVLLVAYFLVRHALGISSPGIGSNASGFGATFYSADDLKARFGAHPLGFMGYNVVSGLLSLLLSEPRTGLYGTAVWWQTGTLHPVLLVNLISSAVTTAMIAWYAAVRPLRTPRAAWSDADRVFVVCCLVMVVNAGLTAAYIKDEIISVGGLFYALAAFIAARAVVESLPGRATVAAIAVTVVLTAVAGLWTFRDLGLHYQLRYDAFKLRNDWAEVLRADKRDDWPRDPKVLELTRRLRAEAIGRRTASPSFMPRWGDPWWVE